MLPAIAVATISSCVGKKEPSLLEEGPSSTDAVERSAPTYDEEKDGEKSCHHNYRKKLLR